MKLNYYEISKIVDEYLRFFRIKRNDFELEFENGEKDQRNKNKKELDKLLDRKLGEFELSKELQETNKDDFLVTYDFNSLHPSAHLDRNSFWPKKETAYPFKKHMADAVCSLFNSGRLKEIIRFAVLTVRYHNPEKLIF